MKMERAVRPGDWVRRSEVDGDDLVLVVRLDGSMFRGRHWLTDRQSWSLARSLGLYPVESSFGWELAEPPVGLPVQCRQMFGHGEGTFFCDLPTGHDGPHSETGPDYALTWTT